MIVLDSSLTFILPTFNMGLLLIDLIYFGYIIDFLERVYKVKSPFRSRWKNKKLTDLSLKDIQRIYQELNKYVLNFYTQKLKSEGKSETDAEKLAKIELLNFYKNLDKNPIAVLAELFNMDQSDYSNINKEPNNSQTDSQTDNEFQQMFDNVENLVPDGQSNLVEEQYIVVNDKEINRNEELVNALNDYLPRRIPQLNEGYTNELLQVLFHVRSIFVLSKTLLIYFKTFQLLKQNSSNISSMFTIINSNIEEIIRDIKIGQNTDESEFPEEDESKIYINNYNRHNLSSPGTEDTILFIKNNNNSLILIIWLSDVYNLDQSLIGFKNYIRSPFKAIEEILFNSNIISSEKLSDSLFANIFNFSLGLWLFQPFYFDLERFNSDQLTPESIIRETKDLPDSGKNFLLKLLQNGLNQSFFPYLELRNLENREPFEICFRNKWISPGKSFLADCLPRNDLFKKKAF